jgi:LPS export ABC transporter protein LptC
VIRTLARIAFVAVIGVTAACSEKVEPGMVITAGSVLDSADQVAFGSRTLLTDAGLIRAEIFADTAMFLDQNTRMVMRVVSGDFYNAQGSKDATLVAERAVYDSRNERLEAWGNVVVTAVDGRVLRSPMLRFDSKMNQISSDSSFVLTEHDGKEMRGIGFDADPNLSVVNIRHFNQGRGGTVNLSRP